MTVKEIIISLCKEINLTQEQLAAKLGSENKSMIARSLNRKDKESGLSTEGMTMKVSTLVRWLEELDAQLVVQSLNTDEEWILDGEDEGVRY